MKVIFVILITLLLPMLARADEIFPVVLPECTAKLERRAVEADVVLVRSDCPLSVQSLAQLLDTGLPGLFPDHKLYGLSIYLGRLMDYPEWSENLAKAAARSPAWNQKRGRPSKAGENDNHRVRLLLNGAAYPQALKAAFAKYGLTACITDVEKVLVFKAKDIFSSPSKMPARLSAQAKLPVDAQLWLKLQPLPTGCIDH
ncbi:MAG: hypothetical protein ACXV7F_04655 [Methylomonas sp.]